MTNAIVFIKLFLWLIKIHSISSNITHTKERIYAIILSFIFLFVIISNNYSTVDFICPGCFLFHCSYKLVNCFLSDFEPPTSNTGKTNSSSGMKVAFPCCSKPSIQEWILITLPVASFPESRFTKLHIKYEKRKNVAIALSTAHSIVKCNSEVKK